MQSYNLEVGWSADDLHAARTALKACKEIEPENPIDVAEKLPDIWQLLKDALPIIEDEANRRDASMQRHGENQCVQPYWREMRELADRIEAIIFQTTKGA